MLTINIQEKKHKHTIFQMLTTSLKMQQIQQGMSANIQIQVDVTQGIMPSNTPMLLK